MAEGQFTGQRGAYVYVADSGAQYSIERDTTLALPSTGLTPYGVDDPFAPGLPKRYKPRGVYWQGVLDGKVVRKFIICGTLDAQTYSRDGRAPLQVDGIDGFTTGKRGEQITFPKRVITTIP